MRPDLVIVFAPVGGGHKAAALATAEAARARGLEVLVLDLFEHAARVVGDTYKAAHLAGQSAAPELYGSAYFAANRRGGAFEPVRRGFDHVVFAGLERRVRELAPRAVVATHHLPLVVLGRARRRKVLRAPLVGVVTDYTAHACWAEKGVDAFAVGCELAREELIGHGVLPRRITLTGIPIRRAFEDIPDVVNPRRGEPTRVLITSGGFGVGPMREIVRSFTGLRELSVTIVCGAMRGGVKRVTREAEEAGVVARVVGFEKDMPRRVAEAHVVVGKAGGLTVSESLAAGRPMITVGTVPGNESYNERLVVQGGAGWAAVPSEVGPLVARLRERKLFEVMGKGARQLVVPHAAERLLALVERLAVSSERRRVA